VVGAKKLVGREPNGANKLVRREKRNPTEPRDFSEEKRETLRSQQTSQKRKEKPNGANKLFGREKRNRPVYKFLSSKDNPTNPKKPKSWKRPM
jgi:hypothetical protein